MTYEELENFGNDINEAGDAGNEARLQELDEQAALYCMDPNSEYRAFVWYFRSNVQAALQDIKSSRSWSWRQENRERQILYLRRAAVHPTFIRLAPMSQASILTNLGDSFSSFGRGVEAIEFYDAALELVPKFAMALGNRSGAMHALLPNIPDPGHATLVAAYAYRNLKSALASDAVWSGENPSACEYFAKTASHIEAKLDPEKVIHANPLDQYSLGRSKAEKGYRRWSLQHDLFLNPLTAVGPHSIAATDTLNLPSYVSRVGDPPTFIAWFNQNEAGIRGCAVVLVRRDKAEAKTLR